eukprot:scaffold213086_cov41-Prasinocladus_malaysianus.AAC.1
MATQQHCGALSSHDYDPVQSDVLRRSESIFNDFDFVEGQCGGSVQFFTLHRSSNRKLLIPVVCTYLGMDKPRIRRAVIVGSLIPL